MSLILFWFRPSRLSDFLKEVELAILAESDSGNQQWEVIFPKNYQGRNQNRKLS